MTTLNQIEVTRIRDLAKTGDTRALAEALNVLQQTEGPTVEVLQLGAETTAAVGNHLAALNILRDLNKKEPKNNRTLRLAGRSFEAIGDFVNARRAYYEAAAADPADDFSLAHAINMYLQTNEFETALSLSRRLESRKPDTAQKHEIWLLQANCLYHLGANAEARKKLAQIAQLDSKNPKVITLNGRLALRDGDNATALAHFQEALVHANDKDRPMIENLIEFVEGKADQGLDVDVTRALFDRYAAKFESHLVKELQYNAPEKIAAQAKAHFGDRRIDLLDLGCGTGLVASALKGTSGVSIGVDISGKMLDEAAKKGLYQRLHQVDIRDALRDTPAQTFDLIVAADVVNYIGKLDELILNAYQVLKPGGLFCFTIELDEANPQSEATATPNLRILHGESAVLKNMRQAHFEDVVCEQFTMRVEGGAPVQSALVTGRKHAA
jgi:predicted TPR repeat methyltransferase